MADVPLYDPAEHTPDSDTLVRLEMWCQCGQVHRQVDPVSYLLPQIAGFRTKHSGKGHGVATAEQALAEREARREAGHRALGIHADYEPKTWTPGVSAFDWSKETV